MQQGEPPEQETIGALFTRLIEDGSFYVRAELALYRHKVYHRLTDMRAAFLLAAAGLMLAMGAAVALCLGLVMGLARWIGPVGAAFVVCITGLILSAILLRMAWSRLNLFPEPPEEDLP